MTAEICFFLISREESYFKRVGRISRADGLLLVIMHHAEDLAQDTVIDHPLEGHTLCQHVVTVDFKKGRETIQAGTVVPTGTGQAPEMEGSHL